MVLPAIVCVLIFAVKMADVFTREKRSEIMGRIRSKDTRPELVVRKFLTGYGLRYRLYGHGLPGKPDIVVSRLKAVVFVNGCFWHQHAGCPRKASPKSNGAYWEAKLKGNVERQRRDIRALKKLGWKVYKVWECETRSEKKLATRLAGLF